VLGAEPDRVGGRRDHRHPLQQEAGTEREGTTSAASVLQGDRVEIPLDGDDLAAPVGGDLLDHEPALHLDLDGTAALRGTPVGVQDIGSVTVGHLRTLRPGSATPVPNRRGLTDRGDTD